MRNRTAQDRRVQRTRRLVVCGEAPFPTQEAPILGADGKPVPALALPESYNTVVDPSSGARVFAPSPKARR